MEKGDIVVITSKDGYGGIPIPQCGVFIEEGEKSDKLKVYITGAVGNWPFCRKAFRKASDEEILELGKDSPIPEVKERYDFLKGNARGKPTKEELIKEARLRGFIDGAEYYALYHDQTTYDHPNKLNGKEWLYQDDCFGQLGCGWIYVNGKWAEKVTSSPRKYPNGTKVRLSRNRIVTVTYQQGDEIYDNANYCDPETGFTDPSTSEKWYLWDEIVEVVDKPATRVAFNPIMTKNLVDKHYKKLQEQFVDAVFGLSECGMTKDMFTISDAQRLKKQIADQRAIDLHMHWLREQQIDKPIIINTQKEVNIKLLEL